MTTTINTATLLADRVATIDYWKKELACLRKHQKALTKATKHVNTVFARHPEIEATAWTSVSAWSVEEPVILRVGVTHKVTSMKEGIASAFMRSLLEAGFDIDETRDVTNSEFAQRTFEFRRPANATTTGIHLTFNASLVDSPDATCRKVQTGVEVREVPTYQMICEE